MKARYMRHLKQVSVCCFLSEGWRGGWAYSGN